MDVARVLTLVYISFPVKSSIALRHSAILLDPLK